MDNEVPQVDNKSGSNLSFEEIFTAVQFNGEVVCTIPKMDEARVRTGIKNLKAKQLVKSRELGLAPDLYTLAFDSTPSATYAGAVDLRISISRKAEVKTLGFYIPSNTI